MMNQISSVNNVGIPVSETPLMSFSESNRLRKRAHQIIPGGCNSYSTGDESFSDNSPGFICRGEGCRVLDVDGNKFIEYGMGLQSVALGHGCKSVARAAYRATLQGSHFLKPTPIEMQLAEKMLSLLPHGDMIKFGKNGSDVTTAAMALARAYTGRDLIGTPVDQAFFPADGGYSGPYPVKGGVPQQIRDLTVCFEYNDIKSVQALFDRYPEKIACIIMEPARYEVPENDFLHHVKEICHKNGAVFILDETITGFRWHLNGAQHFYNVQADLSIYGGAMANGFPISALIGKRELMELEGINQNGERALLLSQIFGAETGSLAAALETIRVFQEENIIDYMWSMGRKLKQGITAITSELNLDRFFTTSGYPCCMTYHTKDQNNQPSAQFRRLFMQETIKRGLLMPSLVVCYAHTEDDIAFTLDKVGEALTIYKKALEEGVGKYLVGVNDQPIFKKYA